MKPEFQGNWVDGDAISRDREHRRGSGVGGLAMSAVPGLSQVATGGGQMNVEVSVVDGWAKGLESVKARERWEKQLKHKVAGLCFRPV